MRRAPVTRLAVLVGCLLLASCSGTSVIGTSVIGSVAVSGLAEAGVIANTKKTIGDHVASLVTGQDCSTVKYSEDQVYCRAYPEKLVVVKQPLYCYRTLGDVDCHTRPNPFGGDPQPVGDQFTRTIVVPESAAPGAEAKRDTFR